ncbi:MAG: DUF2860 family protein [Desulfobacteraceae bacterium]|nr:DUF2860 family protein [Desulfobacteraceae bacterium]MBC2757380.1 DUF2860 family protein [Desulfobacteraceae bacterium]
MKQIGCLCLLLVVLIVPVQVAAQEDEPERGEFFGNIMLGGGLAAGRPSPLEVTDDNEIINGLDERAEHYSEAIPVIMAEIGYAIVSTGTEISLGNKSGRTDLLALAVNQSLDDIGALRIILSHGYNDVWKDPFLVGVKRDETKEITSSFEFDYETILGTGAQLSINGAQIKIDDDQIGIREPDLKRDGTALTFGAGYVIAFNEKNVIIPSIGFVVDERDGKSNSSKGYRLELEHVLGLGKFTFVTNLAFSETEFDKIHPIFNRTRKEKGYELSDFITYIEPFGLRGFSINGLIAYSHVDANIRFFESDVLVIGLGVGYSF